ncbi:MAG: hypothetical protein HYS27_24170 [Deltaproteobacteria bacterium]|nr:hypothetical protein [Deltaproteobacteria bacterium]
MRALGAVPLVLWFVAMVLGIGAASMIAGSCGLEAPPLGSPCTTSVDCPRGYACDVTAAMCLPGAGPDDAGPTDAGPTDAGPTDAGPTDAGPTDAGPTDAGPTDAGPAPCEVIVGADRPPVAFGTTVVVTASASATLQLVATDPDDVTLQYALVSADGVTVDVTSTGTATVTATADGSFRFRATGAGRACSEEQVDVLVVEPSAFDFRFVGAADADWSAPTSWDPAGPPGAGASVFIPRDAAVDVDTSPNVGRLVVATGAALDLGLQVITAGDALVGGRITGNAPIKLRASGGELGGALPAVDVLSASTVTRPTTVGSNLTVTGGPLTVLAPLAVDGNLTTLNLGALTQPADVRVHVELAANFSGERSELTAGTVSVRGGFLQYATQSWGAFAGSGAHTLVLDGAARQQVTLTGASETGRPNHVEIRGPVEMQTNFHCSGDVRVRTGGSLDGPFIADTPGRLFVDTGGTFSPLTYLLRNDFEVEGAYDVDTTQLIPPMDLPVGLPLKDVVIFNVIGVVADEVLRDVQVATGMSLTVQGGTLTTRDLTVSDYSYFGTALGTSRVVVLGNASLQPLAPEWTLAAGSLSFRGPSVSLFNNGYGQTRGFGADGHAWLFDAEGTTVLTSNITARGCELNRTVACTIDADCAATSLGTCKTGGAWLRDVSVASGTTLELGNGVTVGAGMIVLGDLTVAAGGSLIVHEPLEVLGGLDLAPGSVTCDVQALSPICP